MEFISFCQYLKNKNDMVIYFSESLLDEGYPSNLVNLQFKFREPYHAFVIQQPENWLDAYNDITFFQLFRVKKDTFSKLLNTVISKDHYSLIKKKYKGGNIPVSPEKALLIFLWYMSKQDSLNLIAEQFRIIPSTVMHIINSLLYIVVGLKTKYIFWPKTKEEYQQITEEFINYPGVIGAIDGTHINIKVPINQHDSYVDRHLNHSINLMAICTSRKIFTYVFVGFPGSAHDDSRVFANSLLIKNIERYGREKYFPKENYHLIGDSAFPLQCWLMTPYRNPSTRMQKFHNYRLSSDRVCIEHTFGILKGRWRRLQYINTYSVSKAIEITTAACVLHNFCYINDDEWTEPLFLENTCDDFPNVNYDIQNQGKLKRDNIAIQLLLSKT